MATTKKYLDSTGLGIFWTHAHKIIQNEIAAVKVTITGDRYIKVTPSTADRSFTIEANTDLTTAVNHANSALQTIEKGSGETDDIQIAVSSKGAGTTQNISASIKADSLLDKAVKKSIQGVSGENADTNEKPSDIKLTVVPTTDNFGGTSRVIKAEIGTGLTAKLGEIEDKITNKNVTAEGENGNNALVSANATGNKVTVASTTKLQNAVTKAESAVQSVTTGDLLGNINVDNTPVKVSGIESMAGETTEKWDQKITDVKVSFDDASKNTNTLVKGSVDTTGRILTLTETQDLKTAVANANAATTKAQITGIVTAKEATVNGNKITLNTTIADGNITNGMIKSVDGNKVTALTGYSKASSYSNVLATDSLNVALGKLEKGHEDQAGEIKTLKEAVTGGTFWKGVVDKKPANGEGYKNGDMVTVVGSTVAADNNKEFIYNGKTHEWIELGDSTADQTRLTTIETWQSTNFKDGKANTAALADNSTNFNGKDYATAKSDIRSGLAVLADLDSDTKGVSGDILTNITMTDGVISGDKITKASIIAGLAKDDDVVKTINKANSTAITVDGGDTNTATIGLSIADTDSVALAQTDGKLKATITSMSTNDIAVAMGFESENDPGFVIA